MLDCRYAADKAAPTESETVLTHMGETVGKMCVGLIQALAGPKGGQGLGFPKNMYLSKLPSGIINQDWILSL